MNEVRIKGISKRYGKNQILRDISLDINSGEAVAILGTNGCGKSTFLKIIAGCIRADSGSVIYFGEDAVKKRSAFTQTAGYVPQDNSLMEEMSVMDNLRFWYCEGRRNLELDLKEGILHNLGLFDYRKIPVKKLSGGMKKRLSIACAMAKEPKVLILDEPGAALDLVCKEEIKQLILDYKKNGGIVIMSSHEAAEFDICDRWYMIENGVLADIPKDIGIDKLMERMR